jgi:hypothetical protein
MDPGTVAVGSGPPPGPNGSRGRAGGPTLVGAATADTSQREFAFKQRYLRSTGSTSLDGLRVYAVVRLQAWFRMLRVKWKFAMLRWDVYHIAAAEIQYYYRLRLELRDLYRRRAPMEVGRAAVVLQRAWRAFSDRRVFAYYRSIIQFRDRGDAASMLRAINPREAALLDLAAGAHVRFRLGGASFPPTVFYKIFVHRPLVDMCAFSPRVYTLDAAQMPTAAQLHNRMPGERPGARGGKKSGRGNGRPGGGGPNGKGGATPRHAPSGGDGGPNAGRTGDGWYRRVENNNWRAVQVGVIRGVTEPVASADEGKPFHHSRLVRRADVEKRRKVRRREWMRAMYKRGLEEQARQNTALGDYRREYGDNFVIDESQEDEAHDLLQWTESLDFNAYVDNWAALGTTSRLDPLNAEFEINHHDRHEVVDTSDGRASSLNIGSYPSHLASPYDFDELDIDPSIFDSVGTGIQSQDQGGPRIYAREPLE